MTKEETTSTSPATTEDRIAAVLNGIDTAKTDCDEAFKKHFPSEVTLHQFRNEWSKKVSESLTLTMPTEVIAE